MAQFVAHSTHDVDDQSQALDGWQQRYQQLSAGRFQGVAWQMVLDGGTFVREWTNLHLSEHITPPPDHVVLAVPTAVSRGSTLAGQPLQRESLMVLASGQEHDLVSTGEMDLIGLAVHRSVLAQLAPAKLEWLAQAERERNLSLSPDAADAIRRLLMAVSGLSGAAPGPSGTQAPVGGAPASAEAGGDVVPGAEQEILHSTLLQTLLLAMHSQGDVHIPRRADTRQRVVRRAIDFMNAHLHSDIGVGEICAAALASRRTLQYCFEELLQTTPQAYLRALRLNEARRLIKSHGERPIQHVAHDLGFSSASHFTRHYKHMFDELPSDTLRAAGTAAPSAAFKR